MNPSTFQEQVFFTTTRISIPSADNSSTSIGTGFIIDIKLNDEKNKSMTLLISNKHVFSDPKARLNFNFNKKNEDGTPSLGNVFNFNADDFTELYTEHPESNVDLACLNVSEMNNHQKDVYFLHLKEEMLSDFQEQELKPGLDVWFVGYPDNRFDLTNNLPLLRRGYIASIPTVDYNSQKQFIIDAQVFQGSSGSPVFAPIGQNFKLIGIVSATMIKHGQLQTIPTLQTGLGIQQILGLGIVIKSTTIIELISEVKRKYFETIKEQKTAANMGLPK